jgi:hypothetical protein
MLATVVCQDKYAFVVPVIRLSPRKREPRAILPKKMPQEEVALSSSQLGSFYLL